MNYLSLFFNTTENINNTIDEAVNNIIKELNIFLQSKFISMISQRLKSARIVESSVNIAKE